MEGKRVGNVWTGVRRKPLPPLFNGPETPPHPQDVLFVATAAPLNQPDLEFRVSRTTGGLEISGPGIKPVYVDTKALAEAKVMTKLLAQAFDAGRSWVAQGL